MYTFEVGEYITCIHYVPTFEVVCKLGVKFPFSRELFAILFNAATMPCLCNSFPTLWEIIREE